MTKKDLVKAIEMAADDAMIEIYYGTQDELLKVEVSDDGKTVALIVQYG